jgi:hypothetical protein
LAADFSILQFRYLTRLLLWHGRNSCMFLFLLRGVYKSQSNKIFCGQINGQRN